MKSELEKLCNAYYKEWCMTHDPFEDDFQDELEKLLPNVKFSMNYNPQANTSEWIYIKSYN